MTDEIPLFRRKNNPSNKNRHGRQAEKHLGKKIGARTTVGSGSIEGDKGDLERPGVLIESKSTIHQSFSLKHSYLVKISKEALDKAVEPALCVQFVDGTGRPIEKGQWMLIPLRVWQEHFDAD